MQIQELLLKAIITQTHFDEFLSKINPAGKLTSTQALNVYLRGYIARLTESLGEKYEGVWAVLGDEKYFEISKEYIHQNPTNIFNINNYGDNFPEFLKSHPAIEDFPFLADLAIFEKRFFEVFHLQNISCLDLKDIIIPSDDFKIDFIEMSLSDHPYSIFEIWKNRKELKEESNFNWNEPEFLILFKKNSVVNIHRLNFIQYSFIQNLQKNSFYDSIDLLDQSIDEKFITSFFQLVGTLGVIKQIHRINHD